MTSRADKALEATLNLLNQRKAENVVLLDLTGRTSICDHFVICHGSSERQLQSLSEAVENAVRDETGLRPKIEGRGSTEWILMDYGDFIVHIFSAHAREFFRLESLWYKSSSENEQNASENEQNASENHQDTQGSAGDDQV